MYLQKSNNDETSKHSRAGSTSSTASNSSSTVHDLVNNHLENDFGISSNASVDTRSTRASSVQPSVKTSATGNTRATRASLRSQNSAHSQNGNAKTTARRTSITSAASAKNDSESVQGSVSFQENVSIQGEGGESSVVSLNTNNSIQTSGMKSHGSNASTRASKISAASTRASNTSKISAASSSKRSRRSQKSNGQYSSNSRRSGRSGKSGRSGRSGRSFSTTSTSRRSLRSHDDQSDHSHDIVSASSASSVHSGSIRSMEEDSLLNDEDVDSLDDISETSESGSELDGGLDTDQNYYSSDNHHYANEYDPMIVRGSHSGIFSTQSVEEESLSSASRSFTPSRTSASRRSSSGQDFNNRYRNRYPHQNRAFQTNYSVRHPTSRYDTDDFPITTTSEDDSELSDTNRTSMVTGLQSNSFPRSKNFVHKVPLVENLVMGRVKTVLDDEHTQSSRSWFMTTCWSMLEEYEQDGKKRLHKRSCHSRIMIPLIQCLAFLFGVNTSSSTSRFSKQLHKRRMRARRCVLLFVTLFVVVSTTMVMNPGGMLDMDELIMDAVPNGVLIKSQRVKHTLPGVHDFIGQDPDNRPLTEEEVNALHQQHQQQVEQQQLQQQQQQQQQQEQQSPPTDQQVSTSQRDEAPSANAAFDFQYLHSPQHPPNGVLLPPAMEHNLADIGLPRRQSDVPLFWHVPRSAGSTMKEIMGTCMSMVLAADNGAVADRPGPMELLKKALEGDNTNAVTDDGEGASNNPKHAEDEAIEPPKLVQHLEIVQHRDGIKYMNVDTTREPGISRAKNLGLIESGLPQAVISVFAQDASVLFNPLHKGRLFTVFRHPVERTISLFHYLGWAVWEPTYDPRLTHMTLEEYARSPRMEYNWMTRSLTNTWKGELTREHLDIAKTIIRRKCLVGLLDKKEESLRRFEMYFNWDAKSSRRKSKCRDRILNSMWPNKMEDTKDKNINNEEEEEVIKEGSLVWGLLERQNAFDVELYEYAKIVFDEQAMSF